MKKIRHFLAVLLTLVSVLNLNSLTVFASTNQYEQLQTSVDYYEVNYCEEISLDGKTYQLTYSYDNEGNRNIDILELETRILNVITYNTQNDSLYLNNEKISSNDNELSERDFIMPYDDNWIYFGSSSRTITDLETMTAMVFVAGVAAYVGSYCTAAAVLSAMGSTSVNYIISTFNEANVSTTVYKFNSNLVTQWRYNWSVTPKGGSTYGPYTTLSEIM